MKYPYSNNENRLADVIAAIQVMGSYKFYKLSFTGWADRIEGDEDKGEYWKQIFFDHPEFFRLDQSREKASLVLRRSFQKRYDVDKKIIISRDEFEKRVKEKKLDRLSRKPLSNDDIATLIDTAINLHSTELNHKKDNRWWVNIFIGFIGVIIGSLLNLVPKLLS